MAKKNLKSALRAHEAKKAQAERGKAVEEAAKRKSLSIQKGQHSKKVRKDAEPRANIHTLAFQNEDTILLVGEGESAGWSEMAFDATAVGLSVSCPRQLLVRTLVALTTHEHDPSLILATALDSEEECYGKYPDARDHVRELRRLAKRDDIVAFDVDAGDLEACKSVAARGRGTKAVWSKIVFNFPHVGAGHKDESRNVLSNQLMLLRFLISAAPLLSVGAIPSYAITSTSKQSNVRQASMDDGGSADEGASNDSGDDLDVDSEAPTNSFRVPACAGSILITLRNCKPYTLWDVPALAKRLPSAYMSIVKSAPALPRGVKPPTAAAVDRMLQIGGGKAYRIWRSFQFHPSSFPSYAHRRTIGWKEGLSKDDNEDIMRSSQVELRTWELSLSG